jgi:hypothetical protein
MGMTVGLNVTEGAAEAAAGRPSTARLSKARQVDALRIISLLF